MTNSTKQLGHFYKACKLLKTAPRNKADFYARWQNLEFGNRLRSWPDLHSLLKDDYGAPVSIRSRIPDDKKCQYLVPQDQIESKLLEMKLPPELAAFNESAPDDDIVGQGELLHAHLPRQSYYLFWSYDKLPMRKALLNGKEYNGLTALGMLKAYCNPNGYEMLMELLDLYPDGVIEFGVYRRHLGVMGGNNTLIWEVRAY